MMGESQSVRVVWAFTVRKTASWVTCFSPAAFLMSSLSRYLPSTVFQHQLHQKRIQPLDVFVQNPQIALTSLSQNVSRSFGKGCFIVKTLAWSYPSLGSQQLLAAFFPISCWEQLWDAVHEITASILQPTAKALISLPQEMTGISRLEACSLSKL